MNLKYVHGIVNSSNHNNKKIDFRKFLLQFFQGKAKNVIEYEI